MKKNFSTHPNKNELPLKEYLSILNEIQLNKSFFTSIKNKT